jgi:dihydrofolate synthase/folylpolyglutamate synthase
MSPDHLYRETIEYLYALQKHGIKLALSNSVALMEIMGNPHRKFPTVHIAGTNGKGSTAAFAASMLRAAGYRTGLYTSPHLVDFTERIRVDNAPITEAKVVSLAQRVREGYQQPSTRGAEALNPTFFEVTTAMAFTYFAEEGVDIAVIETGMGGRLDSTNVITPLVSVITNIDLEHAEFLGTTLEQIAFEKAGIIKEGVPVVTGAVQPEVVRIIEREAAKRRAPVFRLGKNFHVEPGSPGTRRSFAYRGLKKSYEGLAISLIGRYQMDNAGLALAAIECLRNAGLPVDEAAIRSGLEQARWEGRLERVWQKPDLYLDGAHNPASARMLARAVGEMKRSYRRLVLVIGILGDKDYRGIMTELAPLADHVIVTRPEYSRALDLEALAAQARTMHRSVATAETVSKAIAMVREEAGEEDLVLITGSLYVVGEARAAVVDGDNRDRLLSGLKG